MNIVADQAADGTFEIRVTRSTAPHSAHEVSTSAAAAPAGSRHSVAERSSARSPLRYIVPVVVGVGVVTAAAFAITREEPTFEPPAIPDPQPAEGFEVFRIELAEPPPTLGRAALTFDAGSAADRAGGSGEPAPFDGDPALGQSPAQSPGAPDVGLQQAPGEGGEPPIRPLDEVTREQLRVIPVDTPVLADPALLNLDQNAGE